MKSRHTSGQFAGGGDARLHLQAWLPAGDDPDERPGARGVVAAVHGYGEHGGRLAWLGQDLAARGYATYVYDLRGHGHSSGARGQIRRFGDYLDDTGLFLEEVREAQPGKPLFLLGHSMGGVICALLAEERRLDIRALVLSSPFLQMAETVPPTKLLAARVLSALWPGKDIGNTLQAAQLSHEQAVVDGYVTDPLVHHVARARWAAETLAAQDAAMAAAERISLPLLVLYGTDDTVADTSFMEALFTRAASADKTILRYEGFLHECFNETGRERVFEDLASWLRPRSQASTAEAAARTRRSSAY